MPRDKGYGSRSESIGTNSPRRSATKIGLRITGEMALRLDQIHPFHQARSHMGAASSSKRIATGAERPSMLTKLGEPS